MRQFFRSFFGSPRQARSTPHREHLTAHAWPTVIYAIGDVHGCLPQLRTLEKLIVDDATAISGQKWIVMVGDYVDRGPNSAQVIDHLLRPAPAGFKRFSLAGNHEVMMLDFLAAPRQDANFLSFGGIQTLQSYGLDITTAEPVSPARWTQLLSMHIPQEHVDFIKGLPSTLRVGETLFVHAGIRPGIAVEDQSEDDLFWIREPFLSADFAGELRVVHGHTPLEEPYFAKGRIGIDTGAFATGRLTAARLTADTCRFIVTEP